MQKSSEYNSNNAWIFNGNNGNLNDNNKYNTNSVRPVSDFLKINDPLFLAFYHDLRVAYKLCLHNKAHTPNALSFEINDAECLVSLAYDIWNYQYIPRSSLAFIVTVPCPREIIAADFRDRIVQHYLMMKICPIFNRFLDDDVYSCREGKGCLSAINSLYDKVFETSNGYTEDCYVAKFDIKSFFMSINKWKLYDAMSRVINSCYDGYDKDIVFYLLRITTLINPAEHARRRSAITQWELLPKSKSLFGTSWDKGMAIGNLNSQLMANFYTTLFVMWMRDMGIDFVNYVDDYAIVAKDKQQILYWMACIREKLKEYGLTLHPNKFYIQHYNKGIKFIGGVVKGERMYISNRTVGRCLNKIHYYNESYPKSSFAKEKAARNLVPKINSYLGLMVHFNSYNQRVKIRDSISPTWNKYLYFDKDITKIILRKNYSLKYRNISRIKRIRKKDLTKLNNFC